MSKRFGHLSKRFVLSLAPRQLGLVERAFVADNLTNTEFELWNTMLRADQQHSLLVARRFAALYQNASRAHLAGALLHDIGKTTSQLGTLGRVMATLVGPRTPRFRSYLDHEALGAAMLDTAGSDAITISMVSGKCDPQTRLLLEQADNI